MSNETRTALVTGGNRGLGFETVLGLLRNGNRVLLAAREATEAARAAKEAGAAQGIRGEVIPVVLDVTKQASIDALGKQIDRELGGVDILVNNAGLFPETSSAGSFSPASAFDVPAEKLEEALRTNTIGPFLLMQKLVPAMRTRGWGRVVNVSSGMGQLSEMEGQYPAYRVSKTALNAITRVFAAELAGTNILVNAVCPGWCRTEMGGKQAPRTPEEGADTIVWAAILPDGGPSGGFFRDRKPIAW